jgi:sarcosine oxidase delta subunit
MKITAPHGTNSATWHKGELCWTWYYMHRQTVHQKPVSIYKRIGNTLTQKSG